MVKCPENAVYIQILAQKRAQNYFESNLSSDARYVNLIKDENDMYKQLLLSVGEYVNQIYYWENLYSYSYCFVI